LDGKFFQTDLPEDIKRLVAAKAPGRWKISDKAKGNPYIRNDRNEAICQQRLEGAVIDELAQRFKLKVSMIKHILKQNGILLQKEKKNALIDEIKMMLSLGYTKTAIGRKTGKSRQWITHLIKRERLEQHKKGKTV